MNHFFSKIFSQKRIVQPLLASLILFGSVGLAFAINQLSEGHRLTTSTQTITAYNTCYTAKTTSGSNVFLPTKTAAEWNAFVAHKPANVSLGSCCAGTSYAGYCWYLGAYGQSCDTACATHGGANLSGTKDYVGSGGTTAQCVAVLQVLGISTSVWTPSCNLGCMYGRIYNGSYKVARCTSGTTDTSASASSYRRICACNN